MARVTGLTTCVFDSRTFGQVRLQSGQIADVEAVTAYGRYWYWDLSQKLLATGYLSDLPCGRAASNSLCVYDSRTIANIDGTWVDSITANGRFYNFAQDVTKLQYTFAERDRVSLGYNPTNKAINIITSTSIKLDGTAQSLPSTSIGYVSNPNNDSLIATINNGYGAVATYGYFEGNHGSLPTGGVRRYHYVNSRTVADGTSNSAVEEFAFTGACFSDKQPTLQPRYTGHDDLFPEAQGSLIGFRARHGR